MQTVTRQSEYVTPVYRRHRFRGWQSPMRIDITNRRIHRLLQVAGCLACGFVSWRFSVLFAGREFGGGQLARWNNLGGDLLLLTLLSSFVFDRVVAGCTLVACFLCLPMGLYFTF